MVIIICPAATEMRSGICNQCTVMEKGWGREEKALYMQRMCVQACTHTEDKGHCPNTANHGQEASYGTIGGS